jgi:hypothetical protein
MGALRLDDVNVDGARPHIRLRKETTKGKRPRCVPLWWDAGTLTDLAEWQAERLRQGVLLGEVGERDVRCLARRAARRPGAGDRVCSVGRGECAVRGDQDLVWTGGLRDMSVEYGTLSRLVADDTCR